MKRTTLSQPTEKIEGVGLFSARPASLTIEPIGCPGDQPGILFDIGGQRINAHIDALSSRPVHPAFDQMKARCTSVGAGDRSVATVEHLLSALSGLGVTDAIVRIDADSPHAELPIMDGSALPFTRAILDAGTRATDAPLRPIRVRERIRVEDGDASIVIEPSDTTSYTYRLEYPGTPIGSASAAWDGQARSYAESVAPARTFCLEHEAQMMHSAGLFTHLGYRDMLVIGDEGPIDNALRFEDECARHKLLDLIGDLALCGRPIQARIEATRSGHALAHQAARAILDRSE